MISYDNLLKYDVVFQLMKDFPDVTFTLNGGIRTISEIQNFLNNGVHSVMLGRASYENPWMLSQVDSEIFGDKKLDKTRIDIAKEYLTITYPQLISSDMQSMHNVCRQTLKKILCSF
jgi:tRNA-dihydrouridine synthase A